MNGERSTGTERRPEGRRQEILARIREALRVAAPVPFSHGDAPGDRGGATGQGEDRQAGQARQARQTRDWLPAVEPTPTGMRAALAANLAGLKADLVEVADPAAWGAWLAKTAVAEGWSAVGAMRNEPLVAAAAGALGLPVVWADEPYDKAALEACAAGITRCDALVAQTGSVVVSTATGGGRVLSILPPHHIVVATAAEIVADLPAAFELLAGRYGGRWPGFVSFISGPSRTGDIERILVLGAHGPKKLTVVLAG